MILILQFYVLISIYAIYWHQFTRFMNQINNVIFWWQILYFKDFFIFYLKSKSENDQILTELLSFNAIVFHALL